MATEDFVNGAEDFGSTLVQEFAEPSIGSAETGDLKATQRLLREALSREVALRCQRDRLIERQVIVTKLFPDRNDAAARVAKLTSRQRRILDLILAGHPNKNIAADMGLSQRTVESHRASIMKKTGTNCLPDLVRLALAAGLSMEAPGGQIASSARSVRLVMGN